MSKDKELNELKEKLRETENELSLLVKKCCCLENEKNKLKRYNDDLIDQVKFLSNKVELYQFLNDNKVNVETQTEITKCDYTIAGQANNNPVTENNANEHVKTNWLAESLHSKTRISDLVREVAEHNESKNDYIYDPKTKTHYSKSTGWYYYSDRELFFDPHTKNYYKYNVDKKSVEFYSHLDDNKKQTKDERKSESGESEDGEISSSSDEEETNNCNDNGVEEDDDVVILNDPDDYSCMRIIVKESQSLDIGSLLLMTCKGGVIGNDRKCHIYIPDDTVSKKHAEISFDEVHKVYKIKDLNSDYGTYVNDLKLNNNMKINDFTLLKHNDIINFGDCKVLIHIHEGKDVTCIHCEPGCVQALLKQETAQINSNSKDHERRKKINLLRKKYGIKLSDEYIEMKNVKYNDRAKKRRQTVGSDNPYEKDGEGASEDVPINEKNKGHKLLEKMGWKKGDGLGSKSTGRVDPIQITMLQDKVGLGFKPS